MGVLLPLILYATASVNLQWCASAAHIGEDDFKFQQWIDYKRQFNKTYESAKEDESRMKIYFDNLDKIIEHNERFKKNEVSFEVGMNQLGDWFPEELRPQHTPVPPVLIRDSNAHSHAIPTFELLTGVIPKTKNWVDEGAVSSVKDQGKCGDCWAFSTVGALEGHVFLHNQRQIPVQNLSPQNLLDCVGKVNGIENSCLGGWMEDALDYVKINGIATDDSYPYLGVKHSCKHQNMHIGAKIKAYKSNYESNAAVLKKVVGLIGPVIADMDSTDFGFRFYKSGIYFSENCSKSIHDEDHAFVIVGYDTDEYGTDYWLVKNSRGVMWGENGFIRVQRHYNVCGIENYYAYPEL